MNRRSLLRGGGLLGLTGATGCLEAVPIVGETTLGLFAIFNYHEGDHRFDVRIERNGAVVHESSHRLRGWDHSTDAESPPHRILDCTWGDVPGDYTVYVRSEERDWQRFGVVDDVLRPPDCVMAYVHYGDDVGPSEDPPTFSFVLDETSCSEVRSLPGGCPGVV